MCNLCEKVRISGQQVIALRNGGITDDPHGVTALEFIRGRKQDDPIYFMVCRHEPAQDEDKRAGFYNTEISYCPFCGEKF